jgi:undecaprenyl-diphosphatase
MRSLTGLAAKIGGLEGFFSRLDALELASVRKFVRHSERRAARHVIIAVNLLSNGALYPLIGALIFIGFGVAMLPAVSLATLSILLAHSCYPLMKALFARARPFERDPSIPSLLKPLDRYSFPSGHVMTATAASFPLGAAAPSLVPAAIFLVVLIGWARLAAGHHYPSDLVAGMLLGAICAGPSMVWLLG